MMYRSVWLVLIIFGLGSCFAANILIVENHPSPSHQIWNYAIARGLLEIGHNVTLLGPLTIKPLQHENYTHFIIEDIRELLTVVDLTEYKNVSPFKRMALIYDFLFKFCQYTFQSQGFKDFMNDSQDIKFDLIIIAISSDGCFLPLITKYGYPPTVAISALSISSSLPADFGNDLYPAYIPHFSSDYGEDMTFSQRILNYFYTYGGMLYRKYYIEPKYDELSKQMFGQNVKSTSELRKYMSLYFINWSPILNYPQPMSPNIIPIAGHHIELNPIDKNIEKILNESTNGVILFSLGTNLRSNQLNVEKRQEILNALGQLKQTVLWKFESNIDNLPDNVVVTKWLPQNEILAHPNTKLFISHVGGLSAIETCYFGVPMLGIPFFSDQHSNAEMIVRKGVGIKFNFDNLNSENFLNAINEMLENPKYSIKAKLLSRLLKDQPESPLERAMFWIEYAMRNNGTYLDPKSRHLPLFISSCTDIKVFIASIVLVLVIIFYKIIGLCKKTQKLLKVKRE